MADKPRAEHAIDEDTVRRLLRTQADPLIPGTSSRPLGKTAEGWDCEIWRAGDDLAVRLPRRAAAAPLIIHEQRVLPLVSAAVQATGVALPTPLVCGAPDGDFPWPWSVVPWIEGHTGLDAPRSTRSAWAEPLAAALEALHSPATADAPVNPFRGGPLRGRDGAVHGRIAQLRASRAVARRDLDRAESVWVAGLDASSWSGPAVWIHGDLHPGNILADGDRLVGIVDFGDVTSGDPAYDLAVGWLAFDAAGRSAFRSAVGSRVDEATWVRARAWAASLGLMLLAHSDDVPAYAELGRESLRETIGIG
ncbi:aminoglycoside phosphotransferase family protein [Microbacterium hominis]|uniref:Aminoglycoside phosphotransferase family protein n=1 Tax=Microbacterium hominis TaxID=162426 RepID=A0A7D4PUH9_9MICO|nr:aminoglycoside phosphotransferase family protein [Microbacterium hominis]QKJ19234.1 aminoglycoside phosphotransferase family protein [Microbacterium hominis]